MLDMALAQTTPGTPMSQQECWAVLTGSHVGHVATTMSALPHVVPVRYAVRDFEIDVEVVGPALDSAMHPELVAFEVDGQDGDVRWYVHVVGLASMLVPPSFAPDDPRGARQFRLVHIRPAAGLWGFRAPAGR
ncbi:MAG: pyridoxamine 5'-phosphate oxidase family protein [Acidimicrobiales bacterium]